MHRIARRITALTRPDGSRQDATEDNGSHSTVNRIALATVSTDNPSQDHSWKQNIQRRLDIWRGQKQPIPQPEDPVPCDGDPLANSSAEASQCTPAGANESISDSRFVHNGSIPSQRSLTQVGTRGSLASTSSNSRVSAPSLFSLNSVATSISDVSMSPALRCDVNGLRVRLFRRLKDSFVYLAQDEVNLPPHILEQWETTDFKRLETDLREVVMQIYRKGIDREAQRRRSTSHSHSGPHEYDITFELRWSGRSTRPTQIVTLKPTIWVICGSRWACRDIRAAMEGITWITLPVEIHHDSVPQLSTKEEHIDIDALDLTHGIQVAEGITLYINVEEPSANLSACGLLCCATIKDGSAYSHHFSRIGGLLSATETLTSSQFGISTAHGMLNHQWWHDRVAAAITSWLWSCEDYLDSSTEDTIDISDDEDSDDEDGDYYKGQGLNYLENPFVKSDLSKDRAGFRDSSLVSCWRNVSFEGVFSFLGASMTVGDSQHQGQARLHTDLPSQMDHAMLRLGHLKSSIAPQFSNTYCRRGALTNEVIRVTTHEVNDQLNEGPVEIICGPQTLLRGLLLPGSSCLVLGGEMFTLRKIRTENILGKNPSGLSESVTYYDMIIAQGTSGLWVVKGAALCGMILAVSTTEPYAFMITANHLLSNITSSCPSIEVIGLCSESESGKFYRTDMSPGLEWPLSAPRKMPQPTMIASSLHPQEQDHPLSRIRIGVPRTSMPTSTDIIKQVAVGRKSRWPLRENVSELFSAKLFNKTEIDEIVTPGHVEQYRSQRLLSQAHQDNSTKTLNGYSLSAQGRRRPKQPRRKLKRPACLPTIPEMTSKTHEAESSLDGDLHSIYFFLQSTSYTLTVPAFRHGPIRLAKPDAMSKQIPKTSDAPDWTSFQISAFGAFSHDLVNQYDVDEAYELTVWWESWDLGSPGQLVGERTNEVPSPTSKSCSDYPDLIFSEIESDDTHNTSNELSGWQSPRYQESVEEILKYIPFKVRMYKSPDMEQDAFEKFLKDHYHNYIGVVYLVPSPAFGYRSFASAGLSGFRMPFVSWQLVGVPFDSGHSIRQ
ncbi:hypothetical protein F5B20DRAFT_576514 [Whalleya microplaca]|nr:hypothetical protein F5B20DRAFT_576514 [Whalleya microplaca]